MPKQINVLVTAIGSISSQAVLESLKGIDNVTIFTCDINQKEHLVLSEQYSNFHQVPYSHDETFIDKISEICLTNDIHLIFPLTDPEIDQLIDAHSFFKSNNMTIATPKPEAVRICRNKMRLYKRLKKISDINLIPTYSCDSILSSQEEYPLIAKPAMGRSSEGLFKVKDPEFLHYLRNNFDDYIFQKFIPGDIITVDAVRDGKGNIFTLPRKELTRTSNGAGLTVKVMEENECIHQTVKQICEVLDIEGCINVEFIFDGSDYFLLEINPRFSAGVGFSKLAGYDFVKQCLNVFMDKEINLSPVITEGLYGKLYTDSPIHQTSFN